MADLHGEVGARARVLWQEADVWSRVSWDGAVVTTAEPAPPLPSAEVVAACLQTYRASRQSDEVDEFTNEAAGQTIEAHAPPSMRFSGDWLESASIVTGGLFACAQQLGSFVEWRADPSKSDEAIQAEARELFLEFESSYTAAANAYNSWLGLAHPAVESSKPSRQWGVINICFKTILKCLNHDCSAYLLTWSDEDAERAAGESSFELGAILFSFCRGELTQTINGSVMSMDGVLTWSNDVAIQVGKLDDFMQLHGARSLKLRRDAGL